MKKFKIKYIFLIVIISNLFISCGKNIENKEEDTIRSVKYEELFKNTNIQTTKFSGSLKPLTESNLSFKIPGNIDKIYVKIGDKVKKGQLLATLDNSNYILQVKQAQAMYEQVKASMVAGDYKIAEAKTGTVQANTGTIQAKSAIEQAEAAYKIAVSVQNNAKKDFERYKQLYLNDNIPQSVYDNAKAGLEQATSGVEQAKGAVNQAKAIYQETLAKQEQTQTLVEQAKAGKNADNANLKAVEAQLELAKLQLSYTELRAPSDGIIAFQIMETNENIDAGMPIFKIESKEKIQAEIYVSESVINRIKIGDSAKVTVDTLNKNFEGTIEEIGGSSTGFGGTYVVKIAINQADEEFKAGMAVNVVFNLSNEEEQSQILLPISAVNEDSEHNKFTYIIENMVNGQGVITKKNIKIGKLVNDRIEILSGLTGNEKVVTAGVNMLTIGQKVKLYEEEK